MSSPLSPRHAPSSRSPSSPRNTGVRRLLRRDVPSPAVALILAAYGDLAALREALALAPELARASDSSGRTALHIAAASGHVAVVRELLARGADPAAKDSCGRTPATDAAVAGAIDALRALALADAPLPGRLSHSNVFPDVALARDLSAAAATGDVRSARVLVAAFGANVNSANADDRTPLHFAVEEGHVAVARYLLNAGADPDRPDRRGVTAAHAALSSGNQKLIDLFAPTASPAAEDVAEHKLRQRGASLPKITRVKRDQRSQIPPPAMPVSVSEVHVVGAPRIVRLKSPRYGPPTTGPYGEHLPFPPPRNRKSVPLEVAVSSDRLPNLELSSFY